MGQKVSDAASFAAFNQSFAGAYALMVSGQPIICSQSGRSIPPLSAPDAVVMDVSSLFLSFISLSERLPVLLCPCVGGGPKAESEAGQSTGMDFVPCFGPYLPVCAY